LLGALAWSLYEPIIKTMNPSRPRPFDVIVAGRGPVGAVASLALARAGLKAALVGPVPPLPASRSASDWDPRVYALSPASIALLQSLHVWELVDCARIAPVYSMAVFAGAQPAAAKIDFDAAKAGLGALAWIVEHQNLAQALERALRFRDIPVFDANVAALQISAAEVEVQLEPASGLSLHARLVVGADGSRSLVRRTAGLEGSEVEYDQCGLVANFVGEHSHLDTAYQWFGEDGILAMLPLPLDEQRRGRLSLVWSLARRRAEELSALTPDALAACVTDAVQRRFGKLSPLGASRVLPLMQLSAQRLVTSRVALVGDAGHVIHPLAGQGMNLGFGDVTALARVLAEREPERDCGEVALLRRYARSRAEHVLAMKLTTDGLYRLFYQAPASLQPLRSLGFQLLNRMPSAKRWLARRAAA